MIRLISIPLVLMLAASCSNRAVTKENVDWSRYPKTPTPVSWATIEQAFQNDNVIAASQNHSLQVTVNTKDYRFLSSTEPKIDAIWELVKKVDPKQEHIIFATE